MNRSTSIYCQTILDATLSGTFVGQDSSDEEKASGFIDSKAQRERLAGYATFSGKERDEETGFGYFGARYYDTELLTGWMSVDPMSDKYPSISPYAYCAWNPVKLMDPDGCEIGDYYSVKGKYLGSDGYDDKKIYVAFGDNGKIQKQITNGDYSFNKQYLIDRDALGTMYDYAENSNNRNSHREYGGSIFQDANGNQHVYVCNPGPEYSKGDDFSYVGKYDWAKDYDFDGLTLVTDFHTHHRYLIQFPSKQDRHNVLNESGERYGGASCPYNIMLAMGSRQLFFYDSERFDVVKWSFSTVKSILGRKNEKQCK